MKRSTVFLVDDILIFGATLCETAKVLKKSGGVYGLTLTRGS